MSKGASGKGSSSAETNQTVTNQQVATESGIAVGANSNAAISVTTSDPEVLEAALKANTAVSSFAADTNKFAIGAVTDLAGTSILAQNALATKFGNNVSDLAAQNINLLQSVGQEQSNVALQAQALASRALDQSFGVSRAVAPQDPNYTTSDLASTQSKTIIYIVLGLVAMLGLGFLFLKKSR